MSNQYVGQVVALFGSIVTVALVFTLVTHDNTAKILTALGNTFSGALRASMGH